MLIWLLACTGEEEEETGSPSITFQSPADGAELALGENGASVVVEDFTLVDPSKHGDEEIQLGWIAFAVDGTEQGVSGSTNFTFTLDTAGEHTLEASLVHEDGDQLDPAVVASITVTAVG
ncbi:MAG: hypothetical protein V4850_23335 [Myxococcota bacterium]